MRIPRLLCVFALVLGLAGPASATSHGEIAPLGDAATTPVKDDCRDHAPIRTASRLATAERISATQFFSVAPCQGVRPGAPIIVGDSGCTANFMYRGVDARKRVTTYMGTAGHCVLPGENGFAGDVGEKKWAPGQGQEVTLLDGRRIGEIAYAVHMNSKDLDFALIRIDPGVGVSAQMCHFGGPTSISHDRDRQVTQLHLVGDGTVIGWMVPARTFVASSMANPKAVTAVGAAMLGDSGGPIIDGDGRAVGVLVGMGARWNLSQSEAGYVEILRLPHMLSRAQRVLGQQLTMVATSLR